jgi:hypothetical protein
MALTPTDWSKDVRERFREVSEEDGDSVAAVWELVNELHPDHPAVRDSEHSARLVAARNALHDETVTGVTEAVERGGVSPRVLNHVKAWSGTYSDTYLVPSGWRPPQPPQEPH